MFRISREIERLRRAVPAGGFTILELLVASALLAIIAVIMLGMTDSVRKIYTQTIPRVQAYRDARRAMEVLAASISQATLNTYLDYVNSGGDYRFSSGNSATFVPSRYVRTSELRFLSGNDLAGTAAGSPSRPTHSIFFQAPLGLVSSTNYTGLENLLNSVGFHIEFRDDSTNRPDFFANLPNPPPLSHRFRLIQAIQPSDRLTVYKYTAANPGLKSSAASGTAWMTDTLGSTNSTSRVVADNIIALVVLPKLGAADQAAGGYQAGSLAPDYRYDSTATNSDPALNPNSQLPPLVDLTLVAVDERSFARFQGESSTPKDLGLSALFQTVGDLTNSANPGYAKDLKTLEATLTQNKIDYRVFSVGVPIKAARWSKSQKN